MNENERDDMEDRLDEASSESFPASDPPSWEPLHAGRPKSAQAGASVENNEQMHRFEIRDPGGLAQLQYRYSDDGALILVHTEVPPAIEGRGYASQLAKTALDFARASSLRIVAQCPFVRAYMKRHPEYDDLLTP